MKVYEITINYAQKRFSPANNKVVEHVLAKSHGEAKELFREGCYSSDVYEDEDEENLIVKVYGNSSAHKAQTIKSEIIGTTDVYLGHENFWSYIK